MFKSILAATALVLSVATTQAQTADAIVGTWMPSKATSKVKVVKVGSKYYGNVIWLKETKDENGKDRTDKENPDVAQRTKKLLGLGILKDFSFNSKSKEWEGGTIYDPTKGKTYKCFIKMKDNNTLDVRGYVGVSLIGRTDTWKRAE